MKGVVRVAADGSVEHFKSVAKAAKGLDTTPYLVKEAIKSSNPLKGFTFHWKEGENQPEEGEDEDEALVEEPPEDAADEEQAGPSTAFQEAGAVPTKPVPWQQTMPQEQPAADRLSQALKNFGLGVVTMQEYGTPVPYGHFYVTAMCQAAGKRPENFVNKASSRRSVTKLASDLGLPEDRIIVTVTGTGSLAGTWVHRDLAFTLALFCDEDGERGVMGTVSRALAALADGAGPSVQLPSSQRCDSEALLQAREHEIQMAAIREKERQAIMRHEQELARVKAEGARLIQQARNEARASRTHTERIHGLAITPLSELPPNTFSLCEAAERAAGRQGTADRNMKMLISTIKRRDARAGHDKDMWYWIPIDLSLNPFKNPDGSVYKQIKKTKHRAEEVSRYPNDVKEIVIGKMCALFVCYKAQVFTRK